MMVDWAGTIVPVYGERANGKSYNFSGNSDNADGHFYKDGRRSMVNLHRNGVPCAAVGGRAGRTPRT